MEGKDIAQFVSDLVMYFRDLLICKTTDMPRDIIEVSADTFEKMVSQSQEFSRDQIISIIKDLSGLESNLKWANHPRVLLEVALIKLCDRRLTGGSEDIMERLEQLEKRVNSGSFSIRPGEVSYSNGNENRPGKGEKGPSKPWEDKPEGKTGGMEKNAPVKKPGAPKGAGGENISPERELKCWNSIVDEIKNMGRMMLYTNILKTRAVEIDEKQVGIVLGEGGGFARMVINKPENLELIQELAAKRLGHEVRIKCIDEESLAKEPKQDEVVERLEILAKKNNIPLNVIDE